MVGGFEHGLPPDAAIDPEQLALEFLGQSVPRELAALITQAQARAA